MADTRINMYAPDYVSPPGETLEELLEDRGISQAELAERLGRPKKTINEIVQGKAAITAETALQLEHVLNVPVNFWLRREQEYREFLARQEEGAELAKHQDWLDQLPLRAMEQQGIIRLLPDPIAQLRELLQFFGIASPAQRFVIGAAFRRSAAFQGDDEATLVWLRQGERLASAIECSAFDEHAFRAVLGEIRSRTRVSFDVTATELPRLCAQAGVAVAIVPELPRTRVCGATRWLAPSKALIQLSLRYKTDDQFWFTFFHEAGHILLHGKRAVFLEEDAVVDDTREKEANTFARDLLITPADFQRLVEKHRGYFSAEMIVRFAEEIDIAPSIVVGRLQHEQLLPPSHLNKLKVRITI